MLQPGDEVKTSFGDIVVLTAVRRVRGGLILEWVLPHPLNLKCKALLLPEGEPPLEPDIENWRGVPGLALCWIEHGSHRYAALSLTRLSDGSLNSDGAYEQAIAQAYETARRESH